MDQVSHKFQNLVLLFLQTLRKGRLFSITSQRFYASRGLSIESRMLAVRLWLALDFTSTLQDFLSVVNISIKLGLLSPDLLELDFFWRACF